MLDIGDDDQDRALADEESRLQAIEREKDALESRPHDGFADASRVIRLESEIESVEEQIAREKQRAVHGQG